MSETTTKSVMNGVKWALIIFLVCSVLVHQVMLAMNEQQELNEQRELPAWLMKTQ